MEKDKGRGSGRRGQRGLARKTALLHSDESGEQMLVCDGTKVGQAKGHGQAHHRCSKRDIIGDHDQAVNLDGSSSQVSCALDALLDIASSRLIDCYDAQRSELLRLQLGGRVWWAAVAGSRGRGRRACASFFAPTRYLPHSGQHSTR